MGAIRRSGDVFGWGALVGETNYRLINAICLQQKLSDPTNIHYVFVCQGKDCLGKGSRELLNQIRETLADQEAFRVVPYICFGACAASPNVAVFPDRLWYSTVAHDDAESLAGAILKGEELPDRSGQVSADLKNLVFRLFGKPFRV